MLEVKKNPVEKNIFSCRKIVLKKKSWQFFRIFHFFNENHIFFNENVIEKHMIFIEKIKKSKKFPTFFFKTIFRQEKISFFDRIFFKVHLLVEAHRFDAVSERSRQFKSVLAKVIRRMSVFFP